MCWALLGRGLFCKFLLFLNTSATGTHVWWGKMRHSVLGHIVISGCILLKMNQLWQDSLKYWNNHRNPLQRQRERWKRVCSGHESGTLGRTHRDPLSVPKLLKAILARWIVWSHNQHQGKPPNFSTNGRKGSTKEPKEDNSTFTENNLHATKGGTFWDGKGSFSWI